MPVASKISDALNPKRTAVVELVRAHAEIDDGLLGAIWLSSKKDGVWLVEVLPGMPEDEHADTPMEFLPSKDFRYGLRLYASREKDLLRAVERNAKFAAAVAAGTPIPKENDVTKRLQIRARKVISKLGL